MGSKRVKVAFIGDLLEVPAAEVPSPKPLQDVSRIVYNGYTTSGTDCKRIFVPLVEADLEEHHVGALDKWPYHLRCTACGAVFGYFDCYTTTGEDRRLVMVHCKRCGALVRG